MKRIQTKKPQSKLQRYMQEKREWYCFEEGYDCSEIAEDLFNHANDKGIIYQIKLEVGEIKLDECNGTANFLYHEVYCDGEFIYDPRFCTLPLLKKAYFRRLGQLNRNDSKIIIEIIKEGGK